MAKTQTTKETVAINIGIICNVRQSAFSRVAHAREIHKRKMHMRGHQPRKAESSERDLSEFGALLLALVGTQNPRTVR
jgi:hypothetical protein